MDNEKLNQLEDEDQLVEELDDDALDEVTGGAMQGKVFVTPTTDISDDTRSRI